MNPVKTHFVSSLRKPSMRRQRGDTMIEVLVTVIIIAVGVLGAAALQVTTLKNLSSSHSASVAAIVADDISERMRANPDAALAGDYDLTSAPGESDKDCAAKPCTDPADLAEYDINTWWTQITTLLPSGTGTVERIDGTNTFEVTVRWDEDRSGSTGKTCPKTKKNHLECYRFNVTI